MKKRSYIFEHAMKVRDYECDAQGYVNNANYQHYFEVARHEFMAKHGIKFYDLTKKGIDAVVSYVEIRYKSPLFGMEEFTCALNIKKEGLKYIFNQDIIRLHDRKLCARGKVEVVCLIDGKLSQPSIFDEAFKEYIQE